MPRPAPAGVWGTGCKLLHRVWGRAHYIALRQQPIFQQVKEYMEALVPTVHVHRLSPLHVSATLSANQVKVSSQDALIVFILARTMVVYTLDCPCGFCGSSQAPRPNINNCT